MDSRKSEFHGYTQVADDSDHEDGDDEDESVLASSRISEHDEPSELGGLTLEWCAQDRLTMDCRIEKNCLYGAAIAMPQLARSGNWHPVLTTLAVRVYMMLFVNYLLSGFIAYSLIAKQNVLDDYEGQPHLCDFGAAVSQCPGSVGCAGPGGTEVADERLYGWTAWQVRWTSKAALVALFPQMKDKIDALVDPGEYGVESYWCRLVCIFIFVTAILDDLYSIFRSIRLLVVVPTQHECWIDVKIEEAGEAAIPNLHELHLHVGGIPLLWKVVVVVAVILPRTLLWTTVCRGGIMLLMESADITDMVVNTVALNFILEINVFLFQAYELRATKHFLNALVDWTLHEQKGGLTTQSDLKSWKMTRFEMMTLVAKLFPSRLAVAVSIAAWFIYDYYMRYCEKSDDGTWVSKTVREPDNVKAVIMALIPRFLLPYVGLPTQDMLNARITWSMGNLAR